MDYAANLAIFLVEKTGSCLGSWKGNLPAAQQRALFGRFLGKGKLIIDGSEAPGSPGAGMVLIASRFCGSARRWASI